MNRKQQGRTKQIITGVLLLLTFTVLTNTSPLVSANDIKEENVAEESILTHEEIVILTDQFMERLVQQSDVNNKVIHYDSKEVLLKSFESIAAEEAASIYVDYYYNEETDGLYMIPTEMPPWFNKKNDYDMVQLEQDKIKVEQENESALYGTYTVVFEFTYDDQNWKITKITHA